jgi:class 3 adenylate cyclase
MPLYMDRHDGASVTPEEVAQAHMADLAVQDKYGVKYLTYWFDTERDTVFCLADAPNREAAEHVHREAHGLIPSNIIEVNQETVQQFLGRIYEPQPGEAYAETAFRAILFTDIEGSTALTQELGDNEAMKVLRVHDDAVRSSLKQCGGQEVKHTGDGIMAAFRSVGRAVDCAVALQKKLEECEGPRPGVRVGMSAGEPVTEQGDLFGATVQLAARLCDAGNAGDVLAPSVVKDLCLGKGFKWNDMGDLSLKGFSEPVRVHELLYREPKL